MKKPNWLQRIVRPSELQTFQPPSAEIMEKVIIAGDLSKLTPEQRLSYYDSVCRSLGLNPLTKPFEYIDLGERGGLVLYARKDCTDQLRRLHKIDIKILSREMKDGVIVVTAQARMPNGRQDESIGSVSMPSQPDAKANAMMKAETKAKRRVTLSIAGLGMMDESEVAEMFVDKAMEDRDKDREREAEENRKTSPAIEVIDDTPVTEKNYRLVVCHVGKAEGNILGRTVGEFHPRLLYWLRDHYGPEGEEPRWGNPPNAKDERLKLAVEFAITALDKE